MKLGKCLKLGFYLLLTLIFFTVFPALSKAQDYNKTDAVTGALDGMEAKEKAIILAQNLPQEKKEFRQRLEEEVSQEEEAGGVDVDSYVRYMPSRSLKSDTGKMSVLHAESEYSYDFKVTDKLPVELSFSTNYIGLNEKEAMRVSLPAKLTGITFGVQTTVPFFKFNNTYLRTTILPTFNSDDWAVNASIFRLPVHTFLIYQPNEQWTLVGGISVSPSTKFPVFPIAGFIYKPNDKLTFNIIPERPNISYCINDKITTFLEGGLSGTEFRVNKDGYKGAVLRYAELHMGAGVKLKVNKYITASATLGRMFNRYLQYNDSLGKVDIKNDYYSELRLDMSL